MSDDVKCVFVRLPLDEAQIMKLYNPKKSGNENLLAIGTPVTGGDMKNDMIKCFIPDYVLQDFSSDEPVDGIEEYIMREPCAGYTPLIRQSDHLAALASLQDEVGQLRAALGGLLSEWDKLTRYGSPIAKAANERVNYARRVLVALKGPEA